MSTSSFANRANKTVAPTDAEPFTALLHGPLLPSPIRLALPTVVAPFMTTLLSVAETYFVSSLRAVRSWLAPLHWLARCCSGFFDVPLPPELATLSEALAAGQGINRYLRI